MSIHDVTKCWHGQRLVSKLRPDMGPGWREDFAPDCALCFGKATGIAYLPGPTMPAELLPPVEEGAGARGSGSDDITTPGSPPVVAPPARAPAPAPVEFTESESFSVEVPVPEHAAGLEKIDDAWTCTLCHRAIGKSLDELDPTRHERSCKHFYFKVTPPAPVGELRAIDRKAAIDSKGHEIKTEHGKRCSFRLESLFGGDFCGAASIGKDRTGEPRCSGHWVNP